eukprot:CAMPEP_0182866928 /NCGR_PEP_ID=MMETSP0034_2-20130328/8450_1 /TAXON_ID=156128 /ORGANISM="Nephroselmis pyriformis, Strain CCMP717" /LENGTH=894 /DNA_ID=CAMNT_0024999261 /DNA_START=354 /DNA_END=3038 /DNA_ORIENTATION=-
MAHPVGPNGTLPFAYIYECSDDYDGKECYVKYGDRGFAAYSDFDKCQDSWLLLPGFNLLSTPTLAIAYFLGLIYCFFGVAIVSDVFMSAIETITSRVKKIEKKDLKTGEVTHIEVQYWNATVANLTLMALGSSAPEILLAVLETVQGLAKCDTQAPGELGPSTIVGSAAFNLLAITAVCTMSIPDGEVRRISELPVFLVTATFSILAYIWVLIVHSYWTPDIVTIEEAIITFALFPILTWLAYTADVGLPCGAKKVDEGDEEEGGEDKAGFRFTGVTVTGHGQDGEMQADRREVAQMMKKLKADDAHSSDTADEQAKAMLHQMPHVELTALQWRINAVRAYAGKKHKAFGHRPNPNAPPANKVHPDENGQGGGSSHNLLSSLTIQRRESFTSAVNPIFAFRSRAYSVLESAGHAKITVIRGGPMNDTVTVDYFTEEGTADAGSDFTETKGTLTFKPGVESQVIKVPITDDDQYEPDETFTVNLANPSHGGSLLMESVEVTIIDDDEPGIFSFDKVHYEVGEIDGKCVLTVIRRRGCDGVVTVDYETVDNTAIAGQDYYHCTGTLTFEHGESSKNVDVSLVEGVVPDLDKEFMLRLTNPTGGATVSKRSVAIVTIVDDKKVTEVAGKVAELMQKRMDVFNTHTDSWGEQFKEAFLPEAGVDDDGEEEELGWSDLILHYIGITWKVIFAITPPTSIKGGWVTFGVSLMFVGAVTAIVGELASLFGCVVGLKDSVTAITFVALGTSLPDTFASQQAAVEAPDADAAIGNVTGSNAVNVFLGLGIPWLIASVYYKAQGCDFEVEAGALGFSVLIFSIEAVLAIAILLIKRKVEGPEGGELGGSAGAKRGFATLFVSMWLAYIILSSLQAYDHIKWGDTDAVVTPSPPPMGTWQWVANP